ncbi:hypothetical protein NM688_g396 [Phlebia brevispora]|uniref:Uncharacterized protein n=1 Tax=Phlebia brevispora TaxID=194682 RepID=A0ACC1TER0_9APHY|nr:hypothetical protein NM688_g396 [Phlebia brevispora]
MPIVDKLSTDVSSLNAGASQSERGSATTVLNSPTNKTHDKKSKKQKTCASSVSKLFVKRLSEKAKIPTKGSDESAGFDIYATQECEIAARGQSVVKTDISIALPKGSYGRIAPRSGLAAKNGIDVGAGVIDADYRGEVKVLLFNFSDHVFKVSEGDRIAQLIIEKIENPIIEEVDDLDVTKRGKSGFGSTGVKLQSITNVGPRVFKVTRGLKRGKQMDVPMRISIPETERQLDVVALLDTGSTGSCISENFVKKHNIDTWKFDQAIGVYNADGSNNAGGPITKYTKLDLIIGDHKERIMLLVTDLGKSDMFLGYEWIEHHNPSIDWQKHTIVFDRCPKSCIQISRSEIEEGDRIMLINPQAWLRQRSVNLRATSAMDIAIEQAKKKVAKPWTELVPGEYHDFVDVFTEENFQHLPEHRPWDHVIELLPDAKPYAGKIYSMTLDEQKALDEFLEENLKTGRIRPSKSPWGAPFFFVKKKDGKLRPVQDYRKLNDMTKKNKYPLPRINDLFDKIKKAKYFTKLDVRWGYNNIRMAEGDEEKAAFITNRGLFEPLVMFFGLTNSPSTFQMFMNDIFRDMVLRGEVLIYLDDILIFSDDLNEHRKKVREVLKILRKHGLTCKPEKCEFEVQETEYLGHIISNGSIRMDPAKVEGVTKWPVPTCKKDVQQFLGFANFYRKFIKDFSKIAQPMTKLTGQAEWSWDTEQQDAFERIKTAMTTAPVLAVPNDDDQFKVECDASKFALGAELAQKQDGTWRTIAYLSKSLSLAERNYEIYDRELLGLMTALDEWRHFLMGARQTFEIHTDHKNLEYFRKPQKLNPRQARWTTELQEYDFKLIHKPGSSMGHSDPMSRRPDHARGMTDDPAEVLLRPHWFAKIDVLSSQSLMDNILSHRNDYDAIVKSALISSPVDYSQTEDGLIYRRGRLVIPHDKTLIGQVIAAHHDSVSAGHPDVKTYVKGCEICQKSKIQHQAKAAPLHPNPIPDRNWQYISVDMITHLPESQGYNAILNIVDMKSKDYLAIPTTDELNSEGWANIILKHVFSKHGLPERVFSDRGAQFISKFIKDVYLKLGIRGNPSTAYHPQTDGQTERINQELENYLRIFINHRQTDWPDWLPIAEFKYRNQVHSSTGFSPFYLTHGHDAYTGRMKKIQEEASAALSIAQDTMKRSYDKHRRPPVNYKDGDLVWLEGFNLRTDRPHKKLDDKCYGPFSIIQKIGTSAYKLKLPTSWKGIHPVFNQALLTPYQAPEFPEQEKSRSVPNVETFKDKVEEILDSRVRRGGLQYLVKWQDKPRSENTWEPRSSLLKTYKPLMDQFHTSNPNAPRMPTITIPGGQQHRNIKINVPEDHLEWERWSTIRNQWECRKLMQQTILFVRPEDIPDLIFQRVPTISLDDNLPINTI